MVGDTSIINVNTWWPARSLPLATSLWRSLAGLYAPAGVDGPSFYINTFEAANLEVVFEWSLKVDGRRFWLATERICHSVRLMRPDRPNIRHYQYLLFIIYIQHLKYEFTTHDDNIVGGVAHILYHIKRTILYNTVETVVVFWKSNVTVYNYGECQVCTLLRVRDPWLTTTDTQGNISNIMLQLCDIMSQESSQQVLCRILV